MAKLGINGCLFGDEIDIPVAVTPRTPQETLGGAGEHPGKGPGAVGAPLQLIRSTFPPFGWGRTLAPLSV